MLRPARALSVREVRPTGIEHHGSRDQHAHDAQVGAYVGLHALRIADVERYREHHHLHHPQARDGEPLQQAAPFRLRQCIRVFGGHDVRLVPELRDDLHQPREFDPALVPHDLRASRRGVHTRLNDAVQSRHGALNQPAAGRAGEPVDDQNDRAPARLHPAERIEKRGLVVGKPAVRRRSGFDGGRRPKSIEIPEPELQDQLSGRAASGTADRTVRIVQAHPLRFAPRQRFAAMEAIEGQTRHRLNPSAAGANWLLRRASPTPLGGWTTLGRGVSGSGPW